MFISMQGPWHVQVKSNEGGSPRRFIITGTGTSADGQHSGAMGTSVNVAVAANHAWSISIQSNPGGGFIASDTEIKFPVKQGGYYKFDIASNDAGSGPDPVLDDLILTCSTPVAYNDFVIYGNVSLYGGRCYFNPCRLRPYVIDTHAGLVAAMKNPYISKLIQALYPQRVAGIVNPNPPDPAPYFRPMVLDMFGDAMPPQMAMVFSKNEAQQQIKADSKSKTVAAADTHADTYTLKKTVPVNTRHASAGNLRLSDSIDVLKTAEAIESLFFSCYSESGANLTLTFEQYNRTTAELAGGAYTGTGHRDQLGNAVTDKNGNYLFRFTFDYLPELGDIAAGENLFTALMPDVIVKEVSFSPNQVNYESAPYWNIPNLKRIDICMPESAVQVTSTCYNGSLIGQLGNVFIGGDQNSLDTTSPVDAMIRDGFSNYLSGQGTISVNSPLAGFGIECAAWGGMIDIKGCMYDVSKSFAQNNVQWYTMKIRRSTTADWTYIHETYLHPKYHNRNLPNYIGDPVGPFYPNVGSLTSTTPAYMNIQRQVQIGDPNMDWDNDSIDRYMQLHTDLYDTISGVRTPGTFYLQVDGYTGAGVIITTDLIPLYIHNLDLNFQLTAPLIMDPAVVNAGCGLYRLTDAQLKTPVQMQFMANDPMGFVDNYELSMSRCPSPMIDLVIDQPISSIPVLDPVDGDTILFRGNDTPNYTPFVVPAITPPNLNPNIHPGCPGYKGTIDTFSNFGLVTVEIVPTVAGDGWLRSTEYFTVFGFSLTAVKRVTNGYKEGTSATYLNTGQIMMERLNP